MMDQEHPHESEQGSLLSPSWGDEAPEAEPFQEPRDGPTGHAGGKDYRVPLILQEQAYANHGSQEVQVATARSCPAPTVSYPSGGGRRGLQERGRDPTSPLRRSEQGVLRREALRWGGASGPAPGGGPVVIGGTAGDRSTPLAASWFPVVVDGTRVWRKAGPSSGDMKQG